MKVSIVRKAILESIRSASGVEVVDGMIYIVADDATFLYKVKHDLTVLEKIPLLANMAANAEHVPKPEKFDLECMGNCSINGFKHLVLLGSGSVEGKREHGFLIKLPTNYSKKHLVWQFDLSSLYRLLRSNDSISSSGVLNFEGLAFGDQNVYLLNRGNPEGSKNVVLSFNLIEFVEFIQGHTDSAPFPAVHPIHLPILQNVQTGFSGADFFDHRLWFTSSAEATENAYDDGTILGSEIGLLEVSLMNNGRYLEEKIQVSNAVSFQENNQLFLGKVESVSVYDKDSEGRYTAIAVTDNDGSASEILLLDILL